MPKEAFREIVRRDDHQGSFVTSKKEVLEPFELAPSVLAMIPENFLRDSGAKNVAGAVAVWRVHGTWPLAEAHFPENHVHFLERRLFG